MHLTRQEVSTQIPMPRKGTKYVARATHHVNAAVPVVIAIRDMLKLARTSKEVEKMIKAHLLTINGKKVHSLQDAIQLFDVLKADKSYRMDLLPTGKFVFAENKGDTRLVKVMGKVILSGKKIQFNLHEGSNIIADSKIKIGDSLVLDQSNKIKKHLPLEKSSKVLVFKGKFLGKRGTIHSIKDSIANVKFDKEDKSADINNSQLIVLD
jgi:small subunit ribosomal protein S4e